MKVLVHFYGIASRAVRQPSAELSVPGETTLSSLLDLLVQQYGEGLRHLLFAENGKIRPTVNIAINNDMVDLEPANLEQKLESWGRANAELSLLIVPPVFGGVG